MRNNVKAKIKRGYILEMSAGSNIQIDEDELPLAMAGMERPKSNPTFLQFKKGMKRSDLIAGIVQDKDRVVVEERFQDGKRYNEVRLLSDIFKGMDIEKLTQGNKPKQLT